MPVMPNTLTGPSIGFFYFPNVCKIINNYGNVDFHFHKGLVLSCVIKKKCLVHILCTCIIMFHTAYETLLLVSCQSSLLYLVINTSEDSSII